MFYNVLVQLAKCELLCVCMCSYESIVFSGHESSVIAGYRLSSYRPNHDLKTSRFRFKQWTPFGLRWSRARCQPGQPQWNRRKGPTPLGLNRVLWVPPNRSFDTLALVASAVHAATALCSSSLLEKTLMTIEILRLGKRRHLPSWCTSECRAARRAAAGMPRSGKGVKKERAKSKNKNYGRNIEHRREQN